MNEDDPYEFYRLRHPQDRASSLVPHSQLQKQPEMADTRLRYKRIAPNARSGSIGSLGGHFPARFKFPSRPSLLESLTSDDEPSSILIRRRKRRTARSSRATRPHHHRRSLASISHLAISSDISSFLVPNNNNNDNNNNINNNNSAASVKLTTLSNRIINNDINDDDKYDDDSQGYLIEYNAEFDNDGQSQDDSFSFSKGSSSSPLSINHLSASPISPLSTDPNAHLRVSAPAARPLKDDFNNNNVPFPFDEYEEEEKEEHQVGYKSYENEYGFAKWSGHMTGSRQGKQRNINNKDLEKDKRKKRKHIALKSSNLSQSLGLFVGSAFRRSKGIGLDIDNENQKQTEKNGDNDKVEGQESSNSNQVTAFENEVNEREKELSVSFVHRQPFDNDRKGGPFSVIKKLWRVLAIARSSS